MPSPATERRHETWLAMTQDGTDQKLVWMLQKLADEFGGMGVALAAAHLTNRTTLTVRLVHDILGVETNDSAPMASTGPAENLGLPGQTLNPASWTVDDRMHWCGNGLAHFPHETATSSCWGAGPNRVVPEYEDDPSTFHPRS